MICSTVDVTNAGWPAAAAQAYRDNGRRHHRQQFVARLIRWYLFDAQGAADGQANGGDLLELRQRLRPGQNIFRSGMAVFAQRANGDRGNIALVDRPLTSELDRLTVIVDALASSVVAHDK